MAESVMDMARAMGELISKRVDFFDGEVRKLKDAFDTVPVEQYDQVIPRMVQSILIELSIEFTTCAKTRLGVLRIPYQLTILDSHLSYLRDLKSTLNTFIYSDR